MTGPRPGRVKDIVDWMAGRVEGTVDRFVG